MSRFRGGCPRSAQRVRTELVARLRGRSTEIEEAILARVRALSESVGDQDPDYTAGFRAAVAEVIDHALNSIENVGESPESIPSAAAAQARRAARNGVRLDMILRRYAAGDRMLGEYIMAEGDRFPREALREVLQEQGSLVDRLMAAVSSEYMDELEKMRRSPTQRLVERVQRVLGGESPGPTSDLEYELENWHLGMIVAGSEAKEAARALAGCLSCQSLAVPRGSGVVWVWLGARRQITAADVEARLDGIAADVSLGVGEPHHGLEGWRLTHREAQAAFEVMLRKPQRLTRSSDVLLVAAVLRHESLTKSLLKTYLGPLDDHGDSGRVLRDTLRAYFAAGLNAATAAAALGVDRHTVQRRLRKVEESLGRLLHACHAELEVALSLDEVTHPTSDKSEMLAAG